MDYKIFDGHNDVLFRLFLKNKPDSYLDFIDGDDTYLERDPLERAANQGELFAYKHKGFWACMDTLREKKELNKIWKSNEKAWKVWI